MVPVVVIDGSEGTGRSTLTEALRRLGFKVRDSGAPTGVSQGRRSTWRAGEVYLILDAPPQVCRARLEAGGRGLAASDDELVRSRAAMRALAADLPHCALVDADAPPGAVLERSLSALRRLGVRGA